MDIHKQVDQIESREDLIEFIAALRNHLLQYPSEWENPTLERFLGALAAWTEDSGEQAPSQPTWRFAGKMLYTARIYE